MNNSNTGQRPSKFERQAAKEILKGLWKKAYVDGILEIKYPEEEGIDSKRKAKVLHESLAQYRKYIRKNQVENYNIFLQIIACSLYKVNEYTVKILRKPKKYSNNSQVLLELAHQIPELGLNDNNSLDEVMKDFTQNG